VRKILVVLAILLLTGCSNIKLIRGRPVKLPVETIHSFPEILKNCYTDSDLEKIKRKLEKKTGMEFKDPYYSYSTKYRGIYYVRYFYPLVKQEIYAGAEVWIECSNEGVRRVFYLLLPLE